jgi:hypothetical protein
VVEKSLETLKIRIFTQKIGKRVRKKPIFLNFFVQYIESIVVSSVEISCNLVERLTSYMKKRI